jgi:hypothetical protein
MNLRLKCLVEKTFLQVAVIVQYIPPPKKNARICYWFIEAFLQTRTKIATITI